MSGRLLGDEAAEGTSTRGRNTSMTGLVVSSDAAPDGVKPFKPGSKAPWKKKPIGAPLFGTAARSGSEEYAVEWDEDVVSKVGVKEQAAIALANIAQSYYFIPGTKASPGTWFNLPQWYDNRDMQDAIIDADGVTPLLNLQRTGTQLAQDRVGRRIVLRAAQRCAVAEEALDQPHVDRGQVATRTRVHPPGRTTVHYEGAQRSAANGWS